METTLTSLSEISYIELHNFGDVLINAGLFSEINLMQNFYSVPLASASIGDVSYFNGLYSQWLTLGSPILGASNWDQFASYVQAHPYVSGN